MLGGGTAGTIAVNKLRKRLPGDEWRITVVDQSPSALLPAGLPADAVRHLHVRDEVTKPRKRFIPDGVDLVEAEVDRVRPDDNTVVLVDGREIAYDYLVIATGTTPRPDQTPGMAEAMGGNVHEFYTFDGAEPAGREARDAGPAGGWSCTCARCRSSVPVAPLEFTFLAEAFFADKGMRDQVEITYVTPLEGAFTKPISSAYLGGMLEERGIALRAGLHGRVGRRRSSRSWSRSTSGRSTTTCWSPSRSTWAPTSSRARAWATS